MLGPVDNATLAWKVLRRPTGWRGREQAGGIHFL